MIAKQKERHLLMKCPAEFAECARGRTVTIAWSCRQQNKALNECLHKYTDDATLDKMKLEFLKAKKERLGETQHEKVV